ncbi:hypothetical protein [Streptosporangium sp. NBC_01756]|uniref:hypothetical protein n=1 Tax=Streptosporangium sp. NBC_01756 TaxID=2975950 RepID=UPI002DDC2DBB|nr:hypothetical protein [Streptosporangium sp. NBC_01756]WSC86699.1 hypothetical protein OIE48_00290 [Streptosporangium sp. NBC_01756]
MAISDAARRNHEALFPGHVSTLAEADPELTTGGLVPGDPARMAAKIIESVDADPAPLRMVLGSQALDTTLSTLRKRVADFASQGDLAASTDFPPGE